MFFKSVTYHVLLTVIFLTAVLSMPQFLAAQVHCKVLIFIEPDLCDDNNVILHAAPWNYTPPFTYLWSTSETTQDISVPAGSGTYSVTISDSNGCTAAHSVDLNAFNFTFNIQQYGGCPNEGIQLTIDWHDFTNPGNYEFLWSNGDMTSVATVTTPGNYSVTITDPDTGCSAVRDIDVVIYPEPIPVINGPMNLCSGQTAVLTLSGGPFSSIYWFPGGWDTETVTITEPDVYTVTVYNDFGCMGMATFEVLPGGIDPILSGPMFMCNGQDVTLFVVNENDFDDFLWSNGETSASIVVNTPGIYEITVTDVNNCTSFGQIEVLENIFTIDEVITANTSCATPNGSIDVTVSPSGTYTFIWSNGATSEDITSLSVGDYMVTVSDGNGCSSIETFMVANNTTTPTIQSTVTPSTCGLPNGSIDLTITPSASYTFIWSNGATTEDLSNLAVGMYSVTVTNQEGCSALSTFEIINNNTSFSVTAITTANTSCTSPNGSIDITVNPSGTYTFIWSNGATSEDITSLSGGDYVVTVSDGNGCSSVETFMVANNTITPTIQSTVTPATCGMSNGSIDLTIIPSGSYTIVWSNGATTEDLANLVVGMYSVTVTNPEGCSASSTIEIINNNTSFSVTAMTTTNTSCTTPNGSINVTVSPTGTYTFIWSNGATSEDITSLSGGDYLVTVSDGNGCSSLETFIVTNNTITPTIQSTVIPSICGMPNGSIDLTIIPSGSYTIVWSNGATTEDLSNLAVGMYSVTVTSPEGCFVLTTIEILNNNTSFSVTALITANTSCTTPNGSIDLTVSPSGTYTFIWSNGATSEDIISLSVGDYVVTVSDGNGCSSIETFMVANNTNTPTIQSTVTPSTCGLSNGSIDLTITPSGSYTFVWSNGATTEDLSNLSVGMYSVTVTNPEGCSASSTIEILNNNTSFSVTAMTTANTSCTTLNGSINLTVSPPGTYTFIWSNAATSEDITSLYGGDYMVTVSDGNGCSSIETLMVANNTITPTIQSTVTPSTCGMSNGSIELSITPAGSYTFNWSNGAITEDLANLSVGMYSVTVTNPEGCFALTTIEILNNNTSFSVTAMTTANTSCTTPNGSIDVTISPSGMYTFIWSNGATSEDVTSLSSGNYVVTVSDGNGCSSSETYMVTNNTTTPTIQSTVTAAACGLSNGSIDLTITPSGSYTFVWSNGATTEDLSNLSVGMYSVTVTNPEGCSALSTFEIINNNTSFSVTAITTANTSCTTPNGSIDVTVSPTGTYTITWADSQSGFFREFLSGGDYKFTITDDSGCNFFQNVVIEDKPSIPVVEISAIQPDCSLATGLVVFTSNEELSAIEYSTDGGLTYISCSIPLLLAQGNYVILVRNNEGCITSKTLTIQKTPAQEGLFIDHIDYSEDDVNHLHVLLQGITADDIDTVMWTPMVDIVMDFGNIENMLHPEITHPDSFFYQVIIWTKAGCSDTATISNRVSENPEILAPNIIQTNSTSGNDKFYLWSESQEVVLVKNLTIYERWGEKVFLRENFPINQPEYGWNGEFRGSPAIQGVYVWVAEVLLKNNKTIRLYGDVTVIR